LAGRGTLARRDAVKAQIADKKTQDAISQNIDALGRVLELYAQFPNPTDDHGTRSRLSSIIQTLRRLQPVNNAGSN
jgi:hypothetical protein